MKWVWMIVTVLLAVTGVIGGYKTIEALIAGNSSAISLIGQAGIAIVCLVFAPMTYARANVKKRSA